MTSRKKPLSRRLVKVLIREPLRLIRKIILFLLFFYIVKKIITRIKIRFFKSKFEKLKGGKKVIIRQSNFFSEDGKNFISGGGERYAIDLAKIIKSLGHTPILVQKGTHNWQKQKNGLQIIAVKEDVFYKISDSSLFKKYPIILSNYPVPDNKINKKLNVLVLSHGIFWDGGKNSKYKASILKKQYKSLKSIKSLISVDTNTINWIRATFPDIKQKVNMKYIPNYVDLKTFKPKNKKSENIRILFPRRASEARGYWLVSQIIKPLMDKYKNLEFHFVGFVYKKEIQEDMDNWKNIYKDRIKTMVVASNKMHEVYNNADISIIPTTYSEGTSLSCLEAMACGNAVISTDVGGLPNLIFNNYNGLLIEPKAKNLMIALEKLIIDKELRKTISKNALEVVKTFNKVRWKKEWKEVLEKFLKLK